MNQSSREYVKDCLNDQRERWHRGEKVKVESYLSQQPQLGNDTEAVLDLIYHEMVLREASGERLRIEEYVERFPQMAEQLKVQFSGQWSVVSGRSSASRTLATDHRPLATASPLETRHTGESTVLTQMPNLPGYDILGLLGQGGMGVVYKARHVRLGRSVALKMIRGSRPGVAPERALKEMVRFRLEAEAVARLKHPNVVQIHDYGEFDGQPYFSLELMDGGTLHEKLAGRAMPPRDAAALTETLARAVHFAHLQGIVHRDLKPANVLLDKDGTPKIADFGLAKFVQAGDSHTRTEEILGTPAYMAPEQADRSGKPITPAVDVYALGAILYELLTCRPPFQGKDWMQTLLMVAHDDPTPPRKLQPRIPADLETICLKCLAKEPEHRYASAEALADDLRRLLNHEPIHARPASLSKRVLKWSRRHPAVAAMLVVGMLTVIAGIVAGFWIQDERVRRHKHEAHNELLKRENAEREADNQKLIREKAEREAQNQKLIREKAERDAEERERAARLAVEKREKAAERSRRINLCINKATLLLGQAKASQTDGLDELTKAKAEVERAREYLADDPDPADQKRVDDLRADLEPALALATEREKHRRMVETLERLRSGRMISKDGRVDYSNADALYADEFRNYGIDLEDLSGADAANTIRDRPIAADLISALDDWSVVRRKQSKPGDWETLLKIAIDADADEYRKSLRQAILSSNRTKLLEVARTAQPEQLPSATIVLLAVNLSYFEDIAAAADLLRSARLHQRHADNFRIHFELAECLTRVNPPQWDEAIRHYSSAIAIQPKSVDTISKMGWVLYRKGAYQEARVTIQAALRLDKNHADSHYRLGLILAVTNDVPGAIAAFKESLRLNERGDNAWSELGYAYNSQQKYKDSIDAFRKALELDPNHTDALFGLGFALTEDGDFEQAIIAYRRCVSLRPKYVEAQHNIGIAFLRWEKFDDAVREFEKAIRIDPKYDPSKKSLELAKQKKTDATASEIKALEERTQGDPKDHAAYRELGQAYYRLGQYEKAVEAFENAIKINGNIAEYYVDLAEAQYRLKKYPSAIESATRTIGLDGKLVDAFFYRGNAYYEMGKYQPAVEDFTAAIKLRPESALYYNERGFCRVKLGHFKEAVADFTKATELGPNSAVYFNNLGWALGQWALDANDHAKFRDAIKHLRKAIQLDPNYDYAYNNLGWTYNELSEFDNAITELKKATEINPKYTIAYYNLGWSLNQKKDYQNALHYLTEAIKANSEYAAAYKLRSTVHRSLGNDKEADEDYRKAVSIDPRLGERKGMPQTMP